MNYMDLKSGSDIRGNAYGEHAELNENLVTRIATAYVQLLSERYSLEKNDIRIAIGRDSRITGEKLAKAFAEGVCYAGAEAVLFGMCTTPAMFHCLIKNPGHYTSSVMVTASHHPFDKNGLKFFTKEGGLKGSDITVLLQKAETMDIAPSHPMTAVIQHDYLHTYCADLKRSIQNELGNSAAPLQGMHIVVDAGNGAGGFYADLLQELGANTKGSQFLDPDGFFPNHAPNPENADAMKAISEAVLASGADLGVIFDADCDRAAIVDKSGKELNRNRLIALIAAILLQKKKDIVIVSDSVTSTGLTKFIVEKGGKHHRYKRGYRNVIDEAIRLNKEGIDAPLAIETSGHCALRDNYYIDDGMYLATQLIIHAKKLHQEGKVLGDLIAELEEATEVCERRIKILDKEFRLVGENVIKKIQDHFKDKENWSLELPNYEGVRVNYHHHNKTNSAWFLLRLSVHDPVMPLNIESTSPGATDEILHTLLELLQNETTLDISSLR